MRHTAAAGHILTPVHLTSSPEHCFSPAVVLAHPSCAPAAAGSAAPPPARGSRRDLEEEGGQGQKGGAGGGGGRDPTPLDRRRRIETAPTKTPSSSSIRPGAGPGVGAWPRASLSRPALADPERAGGDEAAVGRREGGDGAWMDAPATAPRARRSRSPSLRSWMDAHGLTGARGPRRRAPWWPGRGAARRPRGRALACATGSPALEPRPRSRPPPPWHRSSPPSGSATRSRGGGGSGGGGGEEGKEGRGLRSAGGGGGQEAVSVEMRAAGTRQWGEGRGGARGGLGGWIG